MAFFRINGSLHTLQFRLNVILTFTQKMVLDGLVNLRYYFNGFYESKVKTKKCGYRRRAFSTRAAGVRPHTPPTSNAHPPVTDTPGNLNVLMTKPSARSKEDVENGVSGSRKFDNDGDKDENNNNASSPTMHIDIESYAKNRQS